MAEKIKQFLRGASTVFDIFPDPAPGLFDAEIRRAAKGPKRPSDWQIVGMHLREAIQKAGKQLEADGTRE